MTQQINETEVTVLVSDILNAGKVLEEYLAAYRLVRDKFYKESLASAIAAGFVSDYINVIDWKKFRLVPEPLTEDELRVKWLRVMESGHSAKYVNRTDKLATEVYIHNDALCDALSYIHLRVTPSNQDKNFYSDHMDDFYYAYSGFSVSVEKTVTVCLPVARCVAGCKIIEEQKLPALKALFPDLFPVPGKSPAVTEKTDSAINLGDTVMILAGATKHLCDTGYWHKDLPDSIDGLLATVMSDYTSDEYYRHYGIKLINNDNVSEFGISHLYITKTQ